MNNYQMTQAEIVILNVIEVAKYNLYTEQIVQKVMYTPQQTRSALTGDRKSVV